jgi:predicted PurR-regulated permease PerM
LKKILCDVWISVAFRVSCCEVNERGRRKMLGLDQKRARVAWTNASVYVAVVLLIVLTMVVRRTLLLFVVAMLFAYLLYPMVDGVERVLPSRSRIIALLIPFVLITALLTGFVVWIKKPVTAEVKELSARVVSSDFRAWLEAWQPMGIPVGQELVTGFDEKQILGAMPQVTRGLSNAAGDIADFLIVPILAFFILKDGKRMCERLLEVFPGRRATLEVFLNDAHTLMLKYMRAILVLCAVTLISFSAALTLMQVPYALLLGLVAGLLEFVPVVGPLASAVLIFGVCEFSGYKHSGLVMGFLCCYRLIQDYVLAPHLMKNGVKLHPLLVIFGVMAGGEIGGVAGIFLSVPVLAMARLVCFEIYKVPLIHSRYRLQEPAGAHAGVRTACETLVKSVPQF